jgi:predicted AlkP superfamily pyrophosphatase or phosphodiesterase
LGIDGCRTDALLAAETPHLHRLIQEGAFSQTNDVLGDRPTGADTVSGPGWSNILTGVWPDKHGVLNNEFRNPNYRQYPNVLRLLKQERPQAQVAALVNWKPLVDHVIPEADGGLLVADGEQVNYVEGDRRVTEAAIQMLTEKDPELLFVYWGQVDVAGHNHGFHPHVPEYMQALKTVDGHVGQVLDAMRRRPSYPREDWLTIVCTDHGGHGTGHGGGQNAAEVRTTFLIFHGPSITQGEIQKPTANVDIVATAFTHLGVPLRAEWKLDGRGLTSFNP